MKNWIVLAAVIIVAAAVVLLMPPAKISEDQVLKMAEATPEANYFKTLYPYAVYTMQERGCVPAFFDQYVTDVTTPLSSRSKDVICTEKDRDWTIEYSATGIVDTSALYVGVDDEGGKVTDVGFISPYDDIYVLNYSFATTPMALEGMFNASDILMRDGWASFTEGDTKYLIYAMPSGSWTAFAVYIEKTPGYDVSTVDTLRSEITAAHAKFETGANKIKGMVGYSFKETNVTVGYLYYPVL